MKTIVAGVAMTLSLAGLAACGSDSEGKDAPKASATPAAAEADLKGIPAVVAVVDDQEISKDDFVTAYENQFQQASQSAQMTGEPVDQDALKKQTADGLVSNKLLLAEAEKRKFTASAADVDKALAEYAEQSGAGSLEAYLKGLADQGLDEARVRSEVTSQLKLDQLLADEAGDKKPTKAELQALYDAAVAQQAQSATAEAPAQTIPPFEEVQTELKEQAQSQKESAAAETLLAKLREKATITVNL
ncbi:MAG: SurA N-terminal domain-containing protein [Aeromicrobium sp.]